MENIPQITDTIRQPIAFDLSPYLYDHCFQGRAVLPAVESMRLLAASVTKYLPRSNTLVLSHARFKKFLYIPDQEKQLHALTEIETAAGETVLARLITRHRPRQSGYARIKEHAVCRFAVSHAQDLEKTKSPEMIHPDKNAVTVTAETIYRELVPFGPCYHNLTGNLTLCKKGAEAIIRTPEYPSAAGLLGSPFALDAAFHAACVWGQRYTNVVGFPVGFEKRIIVRPTQPGQTYQSRILPVQIFPDGIIFNLRIYNHKNEICESIQKVAMRDVSGGTLKPPAWLQEGVE